MFVMILQVLGVNRAASRDSCLKASEELLTSVADVGYSQVCKVILSALLESPLGNK